jgi:ubiquinol oxidase
MSEKEGAMVNLPKEQEATLARPRMAYTPMARMLFWGMDLFYGKPLTLRKVQLLEILARIPYQAWEIRQYLRLTRLYEDRESVDLGRRLTAWAREAQDNEFWHLLVVNERMRQLGIQKNWFWDHLLPRVAAFKYRIFSRLLSIVSIQSAFYLNAQFEDHAEHEYMQFVKDHPELDQEKVDHPLVREHGHCETWGDVFRRIGLDEREHMNHSLEYCGLPTVAGADSH